MLLWDTKQNSVGFSRKNRHIQKPHQKPTLQLPKEGHTQYFKRSERPGGAVDGVQQST